jgi:hypothetical protein
VTDVATDDRYKAAMADVEELKGQAAAARSAGDTATEERLLAQAEKLWEKARDLRPYMVCDEGPGLP